jgi:hypothetical protein
VRRAAPTVPRATGALAAAEYERCDQTGQLLGFRTGGVAFGGGPEQTMSGLYPDNRRVRPTGRMIFYHLGELGPFPKAG